MDRWRRRVPRSPRVTRKAAAADELMQALGGEQSFELGLAALLAEIERRGST
jgi:hypothetical protein